MDSALSALASGIGAGVWYLLFEYIERKQAASRAKYGRGVIEQACYRLGRLWALRNRVRQ